MKLRRLVHFSQVNLGVQGCHFVFDCVTLKRTHLDPFCFICSLSISQSLPIHDLVLQLFRKSQFLSDPEHHDSRIFSHIVICLKVKVMFASLQGTACLLHFTPNCDLLPSEGSSAHLLEPCKLLQSLTWCSLFYYAFMCFKILLKC